MQPIHRLRLQASIAAAICALGVSAHATTNQFRGVNWADKRDNFQSGVLYLSGLSSTDTYASASTVADRIIGQFMSKLGTNAVRMPINEATVNQFWGTYTGAIDVALSKGRVVLCYWGKASGANPPDMTAWWNMWSTVVAKYGKNPNVYVEVFNEPSGYNKTELLNLYDQWLRKFPTFPRKRTILDGTGLAWGVTDVGSDRRFDTCLLAVHDYTFFAGSDMVTESKWANHIKGYVGAYSDRTVATEWGGPMSTGSKNGVTYQPMDYSKPATNFFEAYIRGISQQLRDWRMGSFYWPGLRDDDWYSMTTRTGSGSSIELKVSNVSGLARMQYSWTDTLSGTRSRPGPVQGLRADIRGSSIAIQWDSPIEGTGTLQFVDARGALVRSLPISVTHAEGARLQAPLEGLANGVYRLRLVSGAATIAQTRLLVAR
ncbi:MAG TPA: hypothetical protein PKO15_15630 [Fibrobacteria bacterium]|nr:hypothetical protein [Fibrobacteria bacterium]HOX51647.1 hypothetical protein [Fibrobacteria bacterium]